MKRTSLHPQVKHRRQSRRSQCLWHWPSVALSSPRLKRLGRLRRKADKEMCAWTAASMAQCWADQVDRLVFETLNGSSSSRPSSSDGKSHHPVFTSGNTLESSGPEGSLVLLGPSVMTAGTRREERFLVIGPTMLELRALPPLREW